MSCLGHKIKYLLIPPGLMAHRQSAYRLWFNVYAREMRRNLSYADCDRKEISDRLEPKSWIFLAHHQNRAVGTFRVSFWHQQSLGTYCDLYSLSRSEKRGIAIGTRLMVDKSYRNSGIARRMILNAVSMIENIGNMRLIVDCNPPVNKLFVNLGFERFQSRAISPEYGEVELLNYIARGL